jgi:hypothetical protein
MSNLQSGQVSKWLDPLLKRPPKVVCRFCTSCTIEPSNANEGPCKSIDALLVKLRAVPFMAGEETVKNQRGLCGLKGGVAADVDMIMSA